MVYVTNTFINEYNALSENEKTQIDYIVNSLNSRPSKEHPEFLMSFCGSNGNSKWGGINKTLYHLYIKSHNDEHRLFYCYASDLDDEIRTKAKIIDGVIFIDYGINHQKSEQAAKNYEKSDISVLSQFVPITSGISNNQVLKPPIFWFCLTTEQTEVLNLPQPSLVKGSAGTGKTIVSFELFKQWIVLDDKNKYLYLTYTNTLLKKAVDTIKNDGIDVKSDRIRVSNFENLVPTDTKMKIISEQEARKIIATILNSYRIDNILFTDYFVYAYIRGVMKGNTQLVVHETIDFEAVHEFLEDTLNRRNLTIQEKSRIKRQIYDALTEDNLDMRTFSKEVLKKIINLYNSKKERTIFSKKVSDICDESLFGQIRTLKKRKIIYDFLDDEKIYHILHRSFVADSDIKLLIEIKDKYNQFLENHHYYDDNDYAKYLLNLDISEENKFGGIVVDEVQDLTEIQIEAIVKLSKTDSNNISFFGDPNQTISPTVYDYGRFNSFVYKEKKKINRINLKITHRCGPNLLEYINHLTKLRATFKITTIREDIEPEISANTHKIDTYWACLVEDSETINHVLDIFTRAIDCYLIVDNEKTKDRVIDRIKRISDSSCDQTVMDQIVTVQDAKGLESKNVIIYNLISDNLEIFESLNKGINEISVMAFNKFYVSVTRAKDSIIICEERLSPKKGMVRELFYTDDTLMVEKISSDDIYDYLMSSNDPEPFLDQSRGAIRNKEYSKAHKKALIAIRNVILQFKDSELFGIEIDLIYANGELSKIFDQYNPRHYNEIIFFDQCYDRVLNYLEVHHSDCNLELLMKRKNILTEAIQIRDLCQTFIEYEYIKKSLEDLDIINEYIYKFVKYDDYYCAITACADIKDDNLRMATERVVRYLFGSYSYKEVLESIRVVECFNSEFCKLILERKITKDSKLVVAEVNKKLGGLINGWL